MSKRALPAVLAAALLGAATVPAVASAQIGPGPDNPARPETVTKSEDRSWGWIGVFGLLGLLGLGGARSRTTEKEHDFAGGRSQATTSMRH